MMRGRTRIVGQDDIKITVEVPNSVDPSKPHRIDLPDVRDYWDWELGRKHVQDAFPYLDAGQREIFITGIGPEDFARMFPAEDDEPPHTDDDKPFLPDDEPTPQRRAADSEPLRTTERRRPRTEHESARDMEHFNRYFDKDNPR